MRSSNGSIFRVTGPLRGPGNSPVTDEFPAQGPVIRSFDVIFDLRLNKPLSKQSRGWWFETPSCSSWRYCNGTPLDSLVYRASCINSEGASDNSPEWYHYMRTLAPRAGTARCLNNAVNFLQNPHHRYHKARPWGLKYVLSFSPQWCMVCNIVIKRTAL